MSFAHILVALGIVLIFSCNLIVGKIGVASSPPILFSALRFVIVGLVLIPFVSLRHFSWRLLFAALGMSAHFLLVFVSLYLAEGVGSVAIGLQLYVPFSTVLAALILGEALGVKAIVGIVVAFAGVLLMSFDPVVFNHLEALATVILAAMMQASASIFMRGLTGTHPLQMQLWIALIGLMPHIALSVGLESGQAAFFAHPPMEAVGAILFIALPGTLLGHAGLFFLIKRYPLALSTSIVLAVPVLATALSALVLGEVLTWRLVLGGAITIAGVAVVQFRRLGRTARA